MPPRTTEATVSTGPAVTGPLRPEPWSGESSPAGVDPADPPAGRGRQHPAGQFDRVAASRSPRGGLPGRRRRARTTELSSGPATVPTTAGWWPWSSRAGRRAASRRAGRRARVVGAVVEHHGDAVAPARRDQPARRGHRPRATSPVSTGSGRSASVHTGMAGGQHQAQHALGRPVRRSGTGVGLAHRGPGAVPAEAQHAVGSSAPLPTKCCTMPLATRRISPGRSPRGPGERADPERRRRGEPVRQAAALHQRRAVGADQPDRVVQVPAQVRGPLSAAARPRHRVPVTSNRCVHSNGYRCSAQPV